MNPESNLTVSLQAEALIPEPVTTLKEVVLAVGALLRVTLIAFVVG